MNHSIVTCAYCHEDIERPVPKTDMTKNGKMLADKKKKMYGKTFMGQGLDEYDKKYRNCHIIYRGQPILGERLSFDVINIVDVYHPCCLSLIMKLGIEKAKELADKANEPYQGTEVEIEVCQ